MEDRLITIATDHYTAAEILKARLEDAGIECFLKHVNLLQGAVSEGVQVQIRESDLEKALRIITELKNAQEQKELKDIKQIRRILVPVDFSEFSKNACLYAVKLAKKYDADLKILHVFYAPIVDLVPITDAYSIQVDMDINLREMEDQAKRNLVEFVNEIRETAAHEGYEEVKISYSLREGIVEDEIALMAKAYKPGIIVLGTKGKGEKQSDIIGSVVSRVLDKSKVPVLAIPGQTSMESLIDVRNIVYATDFDDSDYVAIRKLIAIVAAFDVKIYCVHISKSPEDKWDTTRMDALKDYFRQISKHVPVECSFIKGDNPVANLEAFCELNKIDVIALNKRKRGLLQRMFNPGLTKKLIHSGSLPLLLFRA
ncbi:MAG: universal stress protein [Bacteroidales bacterium]|nr:universal stress protein [Bacteroidales bacterium]